MLDLDRLLNVTGLRVYVAATGAGAGIQQHLWAIPGASSFLVGASMPYAASASAEFAGLTPEQYASEGFALDLAMAAYRRALPAGYSDPGQPVGLAVTANVASIKEHRGDHRIHVACITREHAYVRTVILPKGSGGAARETDGMTADRVALDTLMVALFGREGRTRYQDHQGEVREADAEARARFFAHPLFRSNGWRTNGAGVCGGPLYPGTFNPPHQAHEQIADAVREASGQEPLFAICATPPHKPALSVQDMLQRAVWLKHRNVLFSEGDPLYLDKARRWPGSAFAIGADALLSVFDPRWGIDPTDLVRELHGLDTRFYVVGRVIEGRLVTAEEAIARVGGGAVPGMFYAIHGCRTDMSSSQIRAAAQ